MKRRDVLGLLLALIVPSIGSSQPTVTMYGTSRCPYCRQARVFFGRNNIVYFDYDIEKDFDAAARFKRLGGHGVPLIVVGNTIVYGFNENRLKQLLSIN